MSRIFDKYIDYGKKLYDMTGGVTGYIVPAIENGVQVERTFLKFSVPGQLFRPFSWVGFDKKSGTLMYYRHCMMQDFMDTEKYPASTKLKGEFSSPRTPKQQIGYEKELVERYEAIRDFVFEENIPEEQKKLVREFREQWELTVMTDLIPYYEALSPEFFEWLEKSV